ncbi:hypothetical protein XAP6164_4030002 [Xanthomonas phaseoli pv. phaseoli]|uniref:Uncharacterized protein n=1 Tax=Xanthomonas campestris pv. phaseoli TaxID=317013 RepID=A0AB38E6I2_XANCH|nr:hypothetical protein XAP6984_990011 [Xanthomonas phaseoli pv. phaseoli]SON93113.1 hypothetical protein XAP7430_980012 [Xanthomonas phaseoli pv. phaseoli]SOO30108.1 hypothetical protein XAP6164_4030002 [Xanthomonas phaseoli pv. phaseoli]
MMWGTERDGDHPQSMAEWVEGLTRP